MDKKNSRPSPQTMADKKANYNRHFKQLSAINKGINSLLGLLGEQLAKSNELIILVRKIAKQLDKNKGGQL